MLVLLKIPSELYKRKISSIGKLEQNAYILQTENIETKSARVAAKHSTFQDWDLLYFFSHKISFNSIKYLTKDYQEIVINRKLTNSTCNSCIAIK